MDTGDAQVIVGPRVVTEVWVCWDIDRGHPGGHMILCGGSTGNDERVQGAGVVRPLGRKLSGIKEGWGRAG